HAAREPGRPPGGDREVVRAADRERDPGPRARRPRARRRRVRAREQTDRDPRRDALVGARLLRAARRSRVWSPDAGRARVADDADAAAIEGARSPTRVP